MTTPQHCPGWEQSKNLKSFECKCPSCGKEIEIFSDEAPEKKTVHRARARITLTNIP